MILCVDMWSISRSIFVKIALPFNVFIAHRVFFSLKTPLLFCLTSRFSSSTGGLFDGLKDAELAFKYAVRSLNSQHDQANVQLKLSELKEIRKRCLH